MSKLINVVRWFFGFGFAISAFPIIGTSFVGALGAVVCALLLIPPVEKKIFGLLKAKGLTFFGNKVFKVVLFIGAFILMSSNAPKTTPDINNDVVPEVATNMTVTPTVSVSKKAAPTPTEKSKVTASPSPTIATNEKIAAQKELDEFMALAKKGGLVTSYEFSDYATVVYVGSPWYSWTAIQKKDFIAYVGMKKKIITGYGHFEVRDAYTDEKVGELTAFAQELKVYK